MKKSLKKKFEKYLQFIIKHHSFWYNSNPHIYVKIELKENKIKFKYYPDKLDDLLELNKRGWVGLTLSDPGEDDDYRFKNYLEKILIFSLTKSLEWVYTGDDQLLNSRAKITEIERGKKNSDWKITVENLGSLKGLEEYDSENIINKYKVKKSSIFSMFKKKLKADDSETFIKDYKKLKF